MRGNRIAACTCRQASREDQIKPHAAHGPAGVIETDSIYKDYLALDHGSKKPRSPRRSLEGSITVLNAERRWCSSQPLGQTSRPSFFRNRIFLHCLQCSIITPSPGCLVVYPINCASGEASPQDMVSITSWHCKAKNEPPQYIVVWFNLGSIYEKGCVIYYTSHTNGS